MDQADLEGLPEIDYNHFDQMTPAELMKAAKAAHLSTDLTRNEVVERLLLTANEEAGACYSRGVLEILPDGWGFLRRDNYQPSPQDVYVSQSQVKRFGLRPGDTIFGLVRQPKEGEKYQGMLRVESVNSFGTASPEMQRRRNFDELTPLYPDERIIMETVADNISTRIIDLIDPIG
ncbi:MAG: transcription termination factor Rho, partial [Fimbriimonas ginsengisoli]|nr:transcription termination factor Rho [Fimbriimonas ginsengisoli]